MDKNSINIGLMGSFRISDGYPNVKWLIEWMKESPYINIVYGINNKNQQSSSGLFAKSSKSKLGFFLLLFGMVSLSIKSLFSCLYYFYRKEIDIVYAPYPAHISLFMLSFLPKIIRPPVIVDGFISLYDSAVLDRKILNDKSLKAKLLFWFERRALLSAEKIIVDTHCSASHFSKLLKIPTKRIIYLPLMTDEQNYIPSKYTNNSDKINVIFVGTFVPLQGVDVIANAATILADEDNIHFIIIGDGQTAETVTNILVRRKANLTWLKDWQSPTAINKLINNADICLGVFGKSDKAARVWPFKNYANMHVGRAIISQTTKCIPYSEKKIDNAIFQAIPANNPQALADAIKILASSYSLRKKYAEASQRFYKGYLGNDTVFDNYLALFKKLKSLS